jgi:hypothetical protein
MPKQTMAMTKKTIVRRDIILDSDRESIAFLVGLNADPSTGIFRHFTRPFKDDAQRMERCVALHSVEMVFSAGFEVLDGG